MAMAIVLKTIPNLHSRIGVPGSDAFLLVYRIMIMILYTLYVYLNLYVIQILILIVIYVYEVISKVISNLC